jgi:hypothetical protein
MITCKQYVFQLSSGQLAEGALGMRFQAGLHRMSCRHCRAFTRNDQALSTILEAARERAMGTEAPPPSDPS